ncbi:hypothetical protein V5O48_011125 [Marasmius crinis-equi]|uniref:Uncharacterized protein n=1 Tax=Marasmius crinis-equi TaxID=585013 RepID=A0ABR3F6F7_9AGAR
MPSSTPRTPSHQKIEIARSRSSSPSKPRTTLSTPQSRIEKALAKRRDALSLAEENLIEHERERRKAGQKLRKLKAMYKDVVVRSSDAKESVQVSNEELAHCLADVQEITDKVRGLLAADSLDSFTDSEDSSIDSNHSPGPSSAVATATVPCRGSSHLLGNGSGSWDQATRPAASHEYEGESEGEEDAAEAGNKLGDLSIQGPEISQVPVEVGSRFPAYVVYYGKDGKHGLFTGWKSTRGKRGASRLLKDHIHVVKGFTDPDLATRFYEEFS